MPDENCPQDEVLRDCLVGSLPVEAAERVLDHLERCPRCQAKFQTISDAGDTLIRHLRQAAVGLQYAHEHQWLHRDVKPSNLMVDRQGQMKILDLGLARVRAGDHPCEGGQLRHNSPPRDSARMRAVET